MPEIAIVIGHTMQTNMTIRCGVCPEAFEFARDDNRGSIPGGQRQLLALDPSVAVHVKKLQVQVGRHGQYSCGFSIKPSKQSDVSRKHRRCDH
jgi:hypothetical protein